MITHVVRLFSGNGNNKDTSDCLDQSVVTELSNYKIQQTIYVTLMLAHPLRRMLNIKQKENKSLNKEMRY